MLDSRSLIAAAGLAMSFPALAAPPIEFVALSNEMAPTGVNFGELRRSPRFSPTGMLTFPAQSALFRYEAGDGVSVLIPAHEPVAPGVGYSPDTETYVVDAAGRVLTLGGLFDADPGLTYGIAGDMILVAAEGELAPAPLDDRSVQSIDRPRMSSNGHIIFMMGTQGQSSSLWLSVQGQTPTLLASRDYGGSLPLPVDYVQPSGGDLAISAAGDIIWEASVLREGQTQNCVLHSDEDGTTELLCVGDLFEEGTRQCTQPFYPFHLNDSSVIALTMLSWPGGDLVSETRLMYGPASQFIPKENALTPARGIRVMTSNGMTYSGEMPLSDVSDVRQFDGFEEHVLVREGDPVGGMGDGSAIEGPIDVLTANARGDVVLASWVTRPDQSRVFTLMHYHPDFGVRRIVARGDVFEVRPGLTQSITDWDMLNNTGGVGGENSSLAEDGRLAFVTTFASGQTGIALSDLSATASCPADFAPPFGKVDFFDVQAYLQLFAAGDLAADLAPPPSGDGLLTFFDVLEFLNRFSAGCP